MRERKNDSVRTNGMIGIAAVHSFWGINPNISFAANSIATVGMAASMAMFFWFHRKSFESSSRLSCRREKTGKELLETTKNKASAGVMASS